MEVQSHLHYGWRGEKKIGELTTIGKVSTLGSHRAWASLIWVTKDVSDVSFTVAMRFWSDK